MELAKIVKIRGAKIILVTRFPHSPGAELADLIWLSVPNEKPLLRIHLPLWPPNFLLLIFCTMNFAAGI